MIQIKLGLAKFRYLVNLQSLWDDTHIHYFITCLRYVHLRSYFTQHRPWQFDRRVKYDGFTNTYLFVLNQRTITLVPLTLKEVHEDQVRLQKESEKEREAEEKKREKAIIDSAIERKTKRKQKNRLPFF